MKGAFENESGNKGTNEMVYGGEVWFVYPLGAVRDPGLRGVGDVAETDACHGV